MSLLGRTIAAVDYDATRIRVLEFGHDRSGSVKILRKVVEPVPQGLALSDAAALGTHLAEMLRRTKIRTRWVNFLVRREEVLLHHLAVPACPEEELTNLVRFRLSQELPFAIEESTVDYVIAARNEAGLATGVLACASKLEYVDHLRHVARSAGLSIRRIGFRPHANLLACQAAGLTRSETSLFVSLGAESIEFDVFTADGELLFSRSAGLTEASESGSALDRALLQLQRTLPAYRAEARSVPLTQVIVDGDAGYEREFAERARGQGDWKVRPFALPVLSGSPEMSGFSTCYGLAVGQYRRPVDQFDFLHPKRAVDPAARRAKRVQLSVAGLAMLLMVSIGYSRWQLASRERTRQELETSVKALKREATKVDDFRTQIEKLEAWRDRRINWLDELNRLTESLPDKSKVFLSNVTMAEERPDQAALGMMRIDGYAVSSEAVEQFRDRLKSIGRYYVDVGEIKENKETKLSEGYSWSFAVPLKVLALPPTTTSPDLHENASSLPSGSDRGVAGR